MIGIHETNNLIYEGRDKGCGYPVDTKTILSQVSFSDDLNEAKNGLKETYSPSNLDFIFREDSFDPITRVKRGRIYKASNTKPENWRVIAHPMHLSTHKHLNSFGIITNERYYTFYPEQLLKSDQDFRSLRNINLLIGTKKHFSRWKLINLEPNHVGEEVLTIKSLDTMGIVPNLDLNKISPDEQNNVNEKFSKFLDDVSTASPTSIIDRANDFALSLLTAFIREKNPEVIGLTLAMITDFKNHYTQVTERKVLFHTIELLRLLHSRGKQSFQEKHNTRDICYDDSETAISCVTTIIRELNYNSPL